MRLKAEMKKREEAEKRVISDGGTCQGIQKSGAQMIAKPKGSHGNGKMNVRAHLKVKDGEWAVILVRRVVLG